MTCDLQESCLPARTHTHTRRIEALRLGLHPNITPTHRAREGPAPPHPHPTPHRLPFLSLCSRQVIGKAARTCVRDRYSQLCKSKALDVPAFVRACPPLPTSTPVPPPPPPPPAPRYRRQTLRHLKCQPARQERPFIWQRVQLEVTATQGWEGPRERGGRGVTKAQSL